MSGLSVSISLETYTYLIKHENLGDPHSTLVGGERWYPPDVRANRASAVMNELRELGLTRGNELSDEFLDVLTVMQRAAVEYYTFATIDGKPFTYRTASIGRDAVLVSHSFGGAVEIEDVPEDQMRVRLAAALPTTPAARVHSATCSVEDLRSIHEDDLPRMTSGIRDAKRIADWLEQDHVASGELHVGLRDGRNGQRVTQPPVPLWVDTEQGRALLNQNSDGWLNFGGADLFAVAELLGAMEDRLRKR